jgi:transposase
MPRGVPADLEAKCDRVVALYVEHRLTEEAVAERAGISVATVRRYLRRRGIEGRPPERAGEKRARAVELRRRLWTEEAIAEEIGVHCSRVSVLLRDELTDIEHTEIQKAIYAKRERTAPRVERTCGFCEEMFELSESQARAREKQARHGMLFCSEECANSARWLLADSAEIWERTKRRHATIRATLDAQGLASPVLAASLTNWSTAAIRRLEKLPLERREFGGLVRLGVNAREVFAASTDSNARRKLAKLLAALNGTERVGRPSAELTPCELELVARLRAEGLGWRKVRDELNGQRPPERALSHVTVQSAFERQRSALPTA